MDDLVSAYEHKHATRVDIPSVEEAGEEAQAVADAPRTATFRNTVTERGQDPELFWLGKDAADHDPAQQSDLEVDIRSLYMQERVEPEQIIDSMARLKVSRGLFEAHDTPKSPFDRVTSYYHHLNQWRNRLILGDSLLVMTSLLQREGMEGQVQTIYMDPPYGIRFGSNWQLKMGNLSVKESDEGLATQPEVVKAFRDTWELGIHSYLSYLRERFMVCKELLAPTGSFFVQISEANVHLVRCLLDEVLGSGNCVAQIVYKKASGFPTNTLGSVADYILWYAKDIAQVKVRKLFLEKDYQQEGRLYNQILLPGGETISIGEWEKRNGQSFSYRQRPEGSHVVRMGDNLMSAGSAGQPQPFEFEGKVYNPTRNNHWKVKFPEGMQRLAEQGRIAQSGDSIAYIRYWEDFPYTELNNLWLDIMGIQSRADPKRYVVQTSTKAIQRCILLSSDPGDLVLDPTCGSGTSAYVAEQWGRRWITIDSSRVALQIAKLRLLTAAYPYYKLADPHDEDLRLGFQYRQVSHITMKSLANDTPPQTETLYDKPEEDPARLRVSGPFTVETLQGKQIVPPQQAGATAPVEGAQAAGGMEDSEELTRFHQRVLEQLKASGVTLPKAASKIRFTDLQPLVGINLHARGAYQGPDGQPHYAYFYIGPRYGTVSTATINEAFTEFKNKRIKDKLAPVDLLVLLGFSFEPTPNFTGQSRMGQFGDFWAAQVQMGPELLQEGLLKKDRGAASFILLGEPEVAVHRLPNGQHQLELLGLDFLDAVQGQVKQRSREQIAYWEVDTDYNSHLFCPSEVHILLEGNEYENWRKGLNRAEQESLKRYPGLAQGLQLNPEAWARLYSLESEPFAWEPGQRVMVRVVSTLGEEVLAEVARPAKQPASASPAEGVIRIS